MLYIRRALQFIVKKQTVNADKTEDATTDKAKVATDALGKFQQYLNTQLASYYQLQKTWNSQLATLSQNSKDQFPLCNEEEKESYFRRIADSLRQYLQTPEFYIKEHLNHVIQKYNDERTMLANNPVTTTDLNAIKRANCYAALTLLNELIYLVNNLNSKINNWVKGEAFFEKIEEEAIELSLKFMFNETPNINLVDEAANREALYERIHEVLPLVEEFTKTALGYIQGLQQPFANTQTKSNMFQPVSVADITPKLEDTSSLEVMRNAAPNLT